MVIPLASLGDCPGVWLIVEVFLSRQKFPPCVNSFKIGLLVLLLLLSGLFCTLNDEQQLGNNILSILFEHPEPHMLFELLSDHAHNIDKDDKEDDGDEAVAHIELHVHVQVEL
jgi:hypothetical protein